MTDTEQRAQPDQASPTAAKADGRTGLAYFVAVVVTPIAIAILVVGLLVLGAIALFGDSDGGGSSAAVPTTQLNISLTEFAITGDLTAPAGNVSLNVTNAGSIEHDLEVVELGLVTSKLQNRGVEILDLGLLEPGVYSLLCDIPGHAESGMRAELVITDGPGAGPTEGGASGGGHGDHGEMTGEQMDMIMVESMLAFPAETEGIGNPILEPEILADGTKKFTLVAEVTPWEVSPGEFVDAWTYNGVVPGPQIKVDVGDKVQVELTNLTPMGTDIHWHGIHTPNDQDGVAPFTQDPIATGETYLYEFVAEDPAIGMYHAHMHGQVSVVNGMFAAFIIGENPIPYGKTISGVTIPEDLVPVFEEPMVLNDAGVIGLTLNGKSFPATEPLTMNEGEWGVIHYYNEGLTSHPMHLHQFPQLVYAKDGFPLDHPYYADTINVAPGERYSVLFQADTVGTWVYHCHILTHAERDTGMFGMVTALVVTPNEND